jgi:hypothetical protein
MLPSRTSGNNSRTSGNNSKASGNVKFYGTEAEILRAEALEAQDQSKQVNELMDFVRIVKRLYGQSLILAVNRNRL